LVDADGVLVQVALQGGERAAAAEPGEPVGEAIVVRVGRHDRFAEQGGQDALVLSDPGLDVVEAVIAVRDDEQEPNGQDLARSQRAFPVSCTFRDFLNEDLRGRSIS